MNNHIKTVHEGVKPHACNICDRKFSVPSQLKTHVEEAHEGKKKKLHKCDICDVTFKTKISVDHPLCDVCNQILIEFLDRTQKSPASRQKKFPRV